MVLLNIVVFKYKWLSEFCLKLSSLALDCPLHLSTTMCRKILFSSFQAQIKNFITLENLEEEIEKSLNTRISYNFAIDSKGNKYVELPDGSVAKEDKQAKAQDVQQAQSS